MAGMEKLAAYLEEHKISQREFARLIGIDNSVVSRFLSRDAKPKLATAVRIERATNGAVPVSAWMEAS